MAPAPYAKATPIEVINALQHTQSILVPLAVSMNASTQAFYTKNGKLGWPIPSLKQLFSTAVAYKKKCKKGIISSWEDYNDHNVSIFHFSFFHAVQCYEFICPKYLLSIRMTHLRTLFAT